MSSSSPKRNHAGRRPDIAARRRALRRRCDHHGSTRE
jgi:hypothetical protein